MKVHIKKVSSNNEPEVRSIRGLPQLLLLLDEYKHPLIIEYAEKYVVDVPMSDTQPFNKGHYEKVKSKLSITVYDDYIE